MGHQQAQHGTDDTEELLAAHRQLWCHALGYVKSMALKCALDLRIPDTIDRCGGSATLGELLAASEIPASNHDYLRRVMRTLTAMRIFAVSHDDPAKADDAAAISYQLTPASRLLVSSSSSSVDAAAAGAGASKENTTTPSILPNIAHLVRPNTISLLFSMGEWMKDESAASVSLYETVHRQGMWACVEDDAANRASFYESMDADTRLVMQAVVRRCPHVFDGVKSLVDVGGGRGTAAAAVVAAFPHIQRCTVMDLPHVVAEAPAGTAGLSFHGGDMFEHIPSADALMLKWILHDWDEDKCIKIMERCKEAIGGKEAGGKVIIIDTVLGSRADDDDDKTCRETYVLDLHILSFVNGAEREEHEWRRIFLAAGFRDYKITHTRGIPSIIEVFP